MEKNSRIFLAGHRGMVGSAILRKLEAEGYRSVLVRSHGELDLTDQRAVGTFFSRECPEYVFLAAAKAGGILANSTYPADFIYRNIAIQTNVIHASYLSGVRKLLFLGSSCIYPRLAPQPIKEEYLLTGPLEPTNEPYAVAKISGITMCRAYRAQYGCNFISVMPTNLYGPNDNFDLFTSHVLPSLIRKFHESKDSAADVILWGTGSPRREFLFADDLADACVFLMERYDDGQIINIGTGEDLTIRELAYLVRDVVGSGATVTWDASKPDGMPRKLLDVSRIRSLGWSPAVSLRDGIEKTYLWYLMKTGYLP